MTQRVIDLSLPFHNEMHGVMLEPAKIMNEDGLNTTNLHLYSHAGTHMDAPLHFVANGKAIDNIELHKCIGPALVIDLSHKTPNSLITVNDLQPHEPKINSGSRLLLRTDWDLHADQNDYRTHMPRISTELAHWLVGKGIVLLGLETPSVASLRPENKAELTKVHQILLEAEIVIVESVANLRELRQEIVQFIALPLKIDGCDGSPVRAVALENRS